MLRIEFSNNSEKFLENCDDELYNRLNERIRSLALNPYSKDKKKVEGRKEKVFRVRVGATEFFTLSSKKKTPCLFQR